MNHEICDACECVIHCKKNGCVPMVALPACDANQHHEHREGQADTDGTDAERNCADAGLSREGEVREVADPAAVAQPVAAWYLLGKSDEKFNPQHGVPSDAARKHARRNGYRIVELFAALAASPSSERQDVGGGK